MRFHGVDVPKPLIDAYADGRLVLFVGAGASVDSPSMLPDFSGLVERIRTQSRLPEVEFTEIGNTEHDRILGVIDESGIDVHARVAEILSPPNSNPNSLHRAIVELAGADAPRIVTTNFDEHLSTARRESAFHDFIEYQGPALPIGDDFTGLVYLHGRLTQPSHQLVVTDADFGRAYLRDSWAARFLERMFAEFTVLFIGYSHDDVIMTYLGRALGQRRSRYVLTDLPGAATWRRLGIEPVRYPNDDRTHSVLPAAILSWTRHHKMGLLDHRQRINELVRDLPPSGIPEEMDYLDVMLRQERTAQYFTDAARGPAWLDWASTHNSFAAIFDPQRPASPMNTRLAVWFAQQYASATIHTDHTFRIFRIHGQRLSRDLTWALARELSTTPESRALQSWIPFLIDADHDGMPLLNLTIDALAKAVQLDPTLLLLHHLTKPRLHRQESPFGSDTIVVRLRGDDDLLRRTWQKNILPHIDTIAAETLSMADAHIRLAYRQFRGAYTDEGARDALSETRSAIEPHEQDQHPEDFGLLIDIARDSLESALANHDPAGEYMLRTWQSCALPLLQRLAVHGWRVRADIGPTEKLEWLIESDWLHLDHTRHETYLLIRETVGAAENTLIDTLVDIALHPPEHVSARRVYDLIHWISRTTDHPAICQAVENQTRAHPQWKPRENPDFDSMFFYGTYLPQLDITVETLHDQIADDAAAAIAQLFAQSRSHGRINALLHDECVTLIQSTVQRWYQDGFAITSISDDEIVHAAVLRGWGAAFLEPSDAEQVVTFLQAQNICAVTDIVRLLGAELRTPNAEPSLWRHVPGSRQLAQQALKTWLQDNDDAVDPNPDGVPWRLVNFWIGCIRDDWSQDSDHWTGIPDSTAHAIESITTDPSSKGSAEEALSSHLTFLFAADPTWTTRVVLPTLDWSNAERAARHWSNYLAGGRWHDALLDAGIRAGMVQAIKYCDLLSNGADHSLWAHIASITLTSTRDPLDDQWLADCIRTADTKGREAIAKAITFELRRLGRATADKLWTARIAGYWNNRVKDIPVAIDMNEAGEMATWAALLSTSTTEAIELALQRPARLSENSVFFHHVTPDRVVEAAEPFARLILHVLRNTQPPFWRASEMEPLLASLIEHGASTGTVRQVREQVARLTP